jgi:predicted NUDIX family NTP pyrophosphohydrolase
MIMKVSAGILVFRIKRSGPEVFIVHPGGPLWAKKDKGFWSLPKGLAEPGEDTILTAKREFEEETGFKAPEGEYIQLGEIDYPRGDKKVHAWAVEGDFEASNLSSNTFKMKWPPRSDNYQEFPEIDRGGWFSLQQAAVKLFPANLPFLERLANHLHVPFGSEEIPEEPKQGSLF